MTTTYLASARVGRTVLAAAAALALFTALPTATAHAASGTFYYHSSQSGDLELDDPDNGECYLLLQGATSVRNRTNAVARVYYDRGCEEGVAATLAPGSGRSFTGSLPHSVMFG